MVRPSSDVVRAWASASRQYPILMEWVNEWRQRELEQLPHVANTGVYIAQGRCQVLTELDKLIKESPNLAAELQRK